MHLKQPIVSNKSKKELGFTYSDCGPFTKNKQRIQRFMSSVKWGHLGRFDLEPNKHNFPTNPMGSSGALWARLYNNNYKIQNKN